MKPLRFELTYHFAAPPERVWPVLADTERLNRSIGLPPTEPEGVGGEPVRRARVRARLAGLRLEWEEDPFEFVEGRYFWVRRQVLSGPIREFNAGMRFSPTPEGTEVRVQSEFVTSGPVGSALVQGLARKTRRDFNRLAAGLRAHLAGERESAYGVGISSAPPAVREATLAALRASGKEVLREPLADRLCEHLAGASDLDLFRIRPFALAGRWGADRYAVLRLCLRAAAEGVLDLSWDLLCPNCRGAKNRWRRLEDVQAASHCDSCQISFDADFDRAVEVSFRPNADFRRVEDLLYCSGGPMNTPHVAAQTVLPPGGETSLIVPLGPGRYRLRNLTAALAAPLFVEEEAVAEGLEVALGPEGAVVADEGNRLRPGEARLRLENRTEKRQQMILERLAAHDEIATAAQVTVYEEYRNLFSSALLSPTVQLGIRSLPLMFTDLKGSTALYHTLGDATAYALVRDHFTLLENLVSRHGGGIIKTIGDAVMAGFPTTQAAVACALELHRDLAEFNRTAPQPIRLKVGLHQGPCIAVRSHDERLDYFGGTVNLAARTHEQSTGDDIVVTDSILRDSAAAELLRGVPAEFFYVDLRGLGEALLYRLYPGKRVEAE